RENRIPEVPVFFSKPPTTVAAPEDPIRYDPAVTKEVDYEVELGVIIGIGGRDIPRDRALGHVFGYTVTNDVSARDLQTRHLQWFKGKSLDGFCPMGPAIVTADEFGDPQNKRISLRVNGNTKQNANTASMIFPVAAIIDFLSRGMTLEPGDIISTGTPEGVGLGRVPPEYLQDGDLVEAEIEGIGVLRNRVEVVTPCRDVDPSKLLPRGRLEPRQLLIDALHGQHRVCGAGGLVGPVRLHASEPQRETTRILRAHLDFVESSLDDQLGTHVDRVLV